MSKHRFFDAAYVTGSCLVVGELYAAEIFADRLTQTSSANIQSCQLANGQGHWDTVFLIDVDIADFEQSAITGKEVVCITTETALGEVNSQKLLQKSDWQALRDAERLLLAMNQDGLCSVPDDVYQRMLYREQLRQQVDSEMETHSIQ